MWGNFHIQAIFKSQVIFDSEFEFPENQPNVKLLNINYIRIKDHTDIVVPANATFDIDELFMVEAEGEWDQEPPEQQILGVVKTDGTGDSLIFTMVYVSGDFQHALYHGVVGSGNLRQLYPDPENHFGYFDRDLMTVYAKQHGCDQPPGSATDQAFVSIIRLYVDSINFEGNHPLCKETGGDPPTTEIPEPQWVRNTRNESACYTRSSHLNMKLYLFSNFAPLHNLNLYLRGFVQNTGIQLNTVPRQFNMYYQGYNLQNVVSQGPLDTTVNYTQFSYYWAVNKNSHRPPQIMNSSGPHVIYTTYANPVNTPYSIPTNTLGLDLVCKKYANGAHEPHDILAKIMKGIYDESQIIYNPGDTAYQYDDPYYLYRNNHGQCNCYARFFLALAHSIGIPANKVIVFSGVYAQQDTVADTIYYDFWRNTCRAGYPIYYWDLLWTANITDPQGHNGGSHGAPCPPYWSFNYHAMAEFPADTLGNYTAYDPVYDLSGDLDSAYGDWLKFYYTDGQSHNEPPAVPPALFRHASGANVESLYLGCAFDPRPHAFYHPSHPMLLVNQRRSENGANKSGEFMNMENAKSWEIRGYLYSSSLDEKLGWPWSLNISSLTMDNYLRKRNLKSPGYYLIECGSGPGWALGVGEYDHIMDNLESTLAPELPSSAFMNFILKYNDVLFDSLRDEYFGRIQIGSDRFAVGGWFDKFMVVGVYKYFDNVDDFLKLARHYFQLPEIKKEDISITENGEPFYSYIDRENMFMLRGHADFIVPNNDGLSDAEQKDMKMVIELIKYYDKEFLP
jgi:hypothetical protein